MRRRGCWANGPELDVQVHLMSSVFFFFFFFVLFISASLLECSFFSFCNFFFGRRLTLTLSLFLMWSKSYRLGKLMFEK